MSEMSQSETDDEDLSAPPKKAKIKESGKKYKAENDSSYSKNDELEGIHPNKRKHPDVYSSMVR